MIRHIVYFTAKNPKDYDVILNGLRRLAEIPHTLHFEVGENRKLDKISAEGPDFVVYAEFADDAALDAYKAHPIYQEAIDIVRPLRDMRIAADFLAQPA